MKNFVIPNKKNQYRPYLLRKIALVGYSIVLILVNSFGGLLGIEQAAASNITSNTIISLTNQERTSLGLNTLKNNSQLAAAALAKANNMFEEQYWDHFGPNGETPWQFIRGAGYNYVYAGENLAKGFRTSEGVHEAWMASPTHKANIVSANYKDIGIAVVDGVLEGKQTTLVVQMFGNLTTEVAGAVQEPESVPKKEIVTTGDAKVTVGKEKGEIKSIKINSPENNAILNDPAMDVKGEVTNITGEYTVQIFDNEKKVGEATADSEKWVVDKKSDWSEGEHEIVATVQGEDVKSEEVLFEIDSTPPEIKKDTITVTREEEKFVVSFELEGEWKDVTLVSGDNSITFSADDVENNTVAFELVKSTLGSSSTILATDVLGNMTELDVSEYFPMEEESSFIHSLSIVKTDLGDKISIGIVAFIFLLLCIEIFVYMRKGRIHQVKGELFTIGTWWLILAIAVFNGFTGIIT
jgi:hypothetical protein